MVNKDNRYEITMLYICPFNFLSSINIIPDLNYPPRLCVVDKKKKIAIDIENRLKYDYLQTTSRLYSNSIKDKITNSKRVAIPALFCVNTTKTFYRKCIKIMKDLDDGVFFADGNEVLNNEEYFKYILKNDNSGKKVKKIGMLKREK